MVWAGYGRVSLSFSPVLRDKLRSTIGARKASVGARSILRSLRVSEAGNWPAGTYLLWSSGHQDGQARRFSFWGAGFDNARTQALGRHVVSYAVNCVNAENEATHPTKTDFIGCTVNGRSMATSDIHLESVLSGTVFRIQTTADPKSAAAWQLASDGRTTRIKASGVAGNKTGRPGLLRLLSWYLTGRPPVPGQQGSS